MTPGCHLDSPIPSMTSTDEPMSLEISEPSTTCRRSTPPSSKVGTGGLRRLSSFTEQLASDEPALSWQDTCPSTPDDTRCPPRVAFSDSAQIGSGGNCRCSRPDTDRGRPPSLLRPRTYRRFTREEGTAWLRFRRSVEMLESKILCFCRSNCVITKLWLGDPGFGWTQTRLSEGQTRMTKRNFFRCFIRLGTKPSQKRR